MFDTLVVPVILYGSEIWGLETSLNDSEPFEYMHMKFIKEILGVHYKATNAACRAELGRLPLKSKVQTEALNFWEHIITSQNSLVNKIYSLTEQSNLWVKKVKKITSILGYSFISSDPVNIIPLYRLSEAVPMRPFFRAKNGGRCRMHHTRGRNLLGKCIFCLFDLTDRMRIPLPI